MARRRMLVIRELTDSDGPPDGGKTRRLVGPGCGSAPGRVMVLREPETVTRMT